MSLKLKILKKLPWESSHQQFLVSLCQENSACVQRPGVAKDFVCTAQSECALPKVTSHVVARCAPNGPLCSRYCASVERKCTEEAQRRHHRSSCVAGVPSPDATRKRVFPDASLLVTSASLLVTSAPGLTTRNKKLLGAKGIATNGARTLLGSLLASLLVTRSF